MNAERLTIRLSDDLRIKLRQRAKAEFIDQSEVVRLALEEYLTPPGSAHAAFAKAGLIGIVRRGPRDLSTSKKHLDGFGKKK